MNKLDEFEALATAIKSGGGLQVVPVDPDLLLKLLAVARAAIEWRDTRGGEDHPAARSRLALIVERLCPSTKWWCEQCDVEFIAAIGTPCPECGGTGEGL